MPVQEPENVRIVEDLAHKGNVDAAAKLLHDMPLAERVAVAKQIRTDEMSKSGPSLPTMEFTNDGDLKSADVKVGDLPMVHSEYNSNTGNIKSREYKDEDGSVKHAEYDSVSGQKTPLSIDTRRTDGSVVHRRLDQSGQIKYVNTTPH